MHPDIHFETGGREISNDDLDAFEARHGVSLPQEYRQFMLARNGGMPNVETFYSAVRHDYCIHELYQLNDNHPDDLDQKCVSVNWEEGYQNGCLCIGCDPGGSEFFIATRDPDRGAVLFVDRRKAPGLGAVKIADSFHQLMEGLVPLSVLLERKRSTMPRRAFRVIIWAFAWLPVSCLFPTHAHFPVPWVAPLWGFEALADLLTRPYEEAHGMFLIPWAVFWSVAALLYFWPVKDTPQGS